VRELGALIAQRPREVAHQDGVMAARFGTAAGDRLILWNASSGRSHHVHVRLAGSDARGASVPEVCGLARGSQVEVLGQTGARLALHRSDVVVLDVERAAGVTLSVR
jgi:hypothetical protein